MIDPRHLLVELRLAGVGRIVAVTGGKGGIGKSLVAATLALALARRRGPGSTGLLDVDLTGPCAHLVLGAETGFPDEDHGILPPLVGGVAFLSVACFAGDQPAPLRGAEVSSALLELLAITRWGPLDVLVVDLPPGLGDVLLDTAHRLPRAEFLAVTGGSQLVAATVGRTLSLLRADGRPLLGLVENMARGREPSAATVELAARHEVPLLGTLPDDVGVEAALGDPEALLHTDFGRAVAGLAERIDAAG